jgi:hypothetical protein
VLLHIPGTRSRLFPLESFRLSLAIELRRRESLFERRSPLLQVNKLLEQIENHLVLGLAGIGDRVKNSRHK